MTHVFVTLIVKACLATALTQCVDVPVPPEVMTAELSPRSCIGQAGYMASMQYLAENEAYKGYQVGGWTCQLSDHAGAASAS